MAESAAQQVSVERVIDAPAERIFAILSDPRRHPDIDGSGTLQQSIKGPERLELGSTFSMGMKVGVPYRMGNTVVEFEPERRIAWCHFGKHRWRYELEPQADGRTLVRETFDWSTARIPKVIELMGAPARNEPGMVKTLERLAALVEGQDPSHG
jgi:uncharacterized protein YndB with AHSA1/START domain